eukprot:jgi/Botrbrau1/6799/Bobra.0153s0002.1
MVAAQPGGCGWNPRGCSAFGGGRGGVSVPPGPGAEPAASPCGGSGGGPPGGTGPQVCQHINPAAGPATWARHPSTWSSGSSRKKGGPASFVFTPSSGTLDAAASLDEVERRSALSATSPTASRDPQISGSVSDQMRHAEAVPEAVLRSDGTRPTRDAGSESSDAIGKGAGAAGAAFRDKQTDPASVRKLGLESGESHGRPPRWPSLAGKKTPSADDLLALVGEHHEEREGMAESRDRRRPLGNPEGSPQRELSGSQLSYLGFRKDTHGSAMVGKKSASADDVMGLERKPPLKGILKKSASADNMFLDLGRHRRSRSPSPAGRRQGTSGWSHQRSESIEEVPGLEEEDRQKSISLADIDAETLEKLVAEQALGASEEADAVLEADEGTGVEPLFVPSEQGSASASRAGWIPRALRAGVLDEDLLSGLGEESVVGEPALEALSPAVQSLLPSVVTPSKEATIEAGRSEGVQILPAEEYLGQRKAVSQESLEEALDYAGFALAVYYVQSIEDDAVNCYGRKPRPPFRPRVTTETVKADILKYAKIEEQDLLYFSHYNTALTHLPYLIALNRRRKTVVVALRGTMTLADVVTDAVAVPERIDGWLPKGVMKDAARGRRRHRAYAHSGMVATTQNLEADLNKNGILPALLYGNREVLQKFLSTLSETERRKLEGWVGRGSKDASGDRGEAVGISMRELNTEGWRLVVTGHSLGAGAATLLSLKLRDNFKDIRCWAFSPPALMSKNLVDVCREFCTAVVVGKDAVPRASINNLSRLMDEMMTSLARCRQPKLRVLFGGWWNQDKRPPPDKLFYSNADIPVESLQVLEKYFKRVDRKGQAREMFPPGPIMFVRPLKHLVKSGEGNSRNKSAVRVKRTFDCVWITPQELISEGILVSGMMMKDHLLESNVIPALRYAADHSPGQGLGLHDNGQEPDDSRSQFGFHGAGPSKRNRDRGFGLEDSGLEGNGGGAHEITPDDGTSAKLAMCEEGRASSSLPSLAKKLKLPVQNEDPLRDHGDLNALQCSPSASGVDLMIGEHRMDLPAGANEGRTKTKKHVSWETFGLNGVTAASLPDRALPGCVDKEETGVRQVAGNGKAAHYGLKFWQPPRSSAFLNERDVELG